MNHQDFERTLRFREMPGSILLWVSANPTQRVYLVCILLDYALAPWWTCSPNSAWVKLVTVSFSNSWFFPLCPVQTELAFLSLQRTDRKVHCAILSVSGRSTSACIWRRCVVLVFSWCYCEACQVRSVNGLLKDGHWSKDHVADCRKTSTTWSSSSPDLKLSKNTRWI